MERLIGIDFGTSTSVIRTKLYDDCDKPVGQELFAQPVVFNNGSSMVPTIVRRLDDSYSFGYEAEIPVKHSEVFRSFKIDLQSEDEEKRELAKLLTRKYFEFLYSDYEHQLVCGLLGDINADNVTTVSYPVKWETETRDFMIQAAKDAGFENVRGMDEAEGAIRAVFVQCKDKLKNDGLVSEGETSNVMLIDMGAGTTDIVISKYTPGADYSNEIITVWPKGGDVLFGGQEIDKMLMDFIISRFPAQCAAQLGDRITIDRIKAWKENTVSAILKNGGAVTDCGYADNIAFCMGVELEEFKIDREEFENLFKDYISQFVQLIAGAILDSGLSPQEIDLVVLTGGHSNWYFVNEILSGVMKKFGELNLTKIIENPERILKIALPQETVALGLVYSKISGTLKFDRGEHLWKVYLETGSVSTLEEAVEHDYPEAINELATKHLTGNGVEQNREKAVQLFQQAAQLGVAQAYHNLGCCYCEKGNYNDGFKAFEKASEMSIPESVNNLALCYQHGLGCEKNADKALENFRKAYDLGFSAAEKNYNSLLHAVYPNSHSEIVHNISSNAVEYFKSINTVLTPSLCVGENIQRQKVLSFLSPNYVTDYKNQNLICYYDGTFFGVGQNGFLLTEQRIYWRHYFGGALFIEVNTINNVRLEGNTIRVLYGDNRSFTLPFTETAYKAKLVDVLNKMVDYLKYNNQ